jgi:hypothetical protein
MKIAIIRPNTQDFLAIYKMIRLAMAIRLFFMYQAFHFVGLVKQAVVF